MREVSIALTHYPVLDRQGEIVTTAITNLDLHDMARSARVFGLRNMFVVHPVAAQRQLAECIQQHWTSGSGARRIPDRVAPMELLRVAASLAQVYQELGGRDRIELWTTSAKSNDSSVCPYSDSRARIHSSGPPVLIVFGTGWGLAPQVIEDADLRLAPIHAASNTGFNHLSVRAACAITLDRLLGER